jgi:hypothetical protein
MMKIKAIFTLVFLALVLVGIQPSYADDAVVGDGTPESCSEAALDDAVLLTAVSNGGAITFNCGPGQLMMIITSVKALTNGTTIDGGGLITLSGNDAVPIFQVSGTVVIDNIVLTHGYGYGGGAIEVNADANLTMTNSQITFNTAESSGGGMLISSGASVTLNNVTLADNVAPFGGGIRNASELYLNDVTLLQNYSSYGGGGLYNDSVAILNNVTLARNSSDNGGGIMNAAGSTVTLNNVTVSANVANSGGGVFNNGTALLTNVTLTENSAAGGGGGGILHNNGGGAYLQMTNAILVNNVAAVVGTEQCLLYQTSDIIYSLWAGTSCGDSTADGNQPNTDMALAPLDFTGTGLLTELTMTHALLPGSPAQDTGTCSFGAPGSDQRGVLRPQGAGCDMGAVEHDVLTWYVYLPMVIR